MQFVRTDAAPTPAGHYSQAVVANGFVFVAGILPIEPGGGERRIPDGIDAQARLALGNLRAILEAAGSALDRLVSVQIFIPSMDAWPAINAAYAEMLGDHRPARTVIPCGALHYGALVEVNAIALAPG